nr:ezrin [Hymenolepis microstoma]
MSFDHRSTAGNEDLIKRLFNKIYTAIISEKIFCPPETAVYLAAYACQAKFGPAISLRNPVPPVNDLLPKSTLDNHNLSIGEWEDRISKWHLKLGDTPFQDAIVEYLDIAQDVELYGASIFEVETQSQVRKWISLDAVGLNIYDSKRKPPTRRYVWSDISSFVAKDNKIKLKLAHDPKQTIEFIVQNQQTGKLLEGLFAGSKELYSRRKKNDVSSKYVRRSESNSSLRMRPHTLSTTELMQLEQQITELELELPRRATDYEYAAWQVKDQLRQSRGIEAKLALNQPSTEDTRQLQHRVAQIRVFLEQDFFKEKEPLNRLHRYRGNFAIRVGGTLMGRSEGYSSDIDSESESTNAPEKATGMKSTHKYSNVRSSEITASINNGNVKSTAPQFVQPKHLASLVPADTPSPILSPSNSKDHGHVDYSFNENGKSPKDPPLSTMPSLPHPLSPGGTSPLKPPTTHSSPKPITYNPDAYPKLPETSIPTFVSDDQSLSTSIPIRGNPGYPQFRDSPLSTPQSWKQVLSPTDHESSRGYAKGTDDSNESLHNWSEVQLFKKLCASVILYLC